MARHVMANLNPSRTAQDTFKEILQQPKGEFQYLRELVQNSVEAGASQIKITYEPEAWDKFRVARMMIVDNGCGFSKEDFQRIVDLNSSGKNTEGVHRNYGIGAKISTLGFNPHGFVVLSWRGDEANMVRVRFDENDKMFMVSDEKVILNEEVEDTLSNGKTPGVFEPCYVSELMVDFSKTLKRIRKSQPSGTAVILCGKHPFESTLRRNAARKQINGSNITGYLNQRYYELPLIKDQSEGRVSIHFVGAPLPVNTQGTSRDQMNKSFDVYEDAIYSKWLGLRGDEFYEEIYAYQSLSEEIDLTETAVEGGDIGEEGTLTSFPTPSEIEGIQNGRELADFVKTTWLKIKRENKQRTQKVVGYKALLRKSPAQGSLLCQQESDTLSSVVDWYVVDDNTWKGFSSHDIPVPERKASVALLYQDEVFNLDVGNSAKHALTTRWGIPYFTNSSLSEDEDVRDRVKIFVRLPLFPEDDMGEGIRPNKTRTALVWEAVKRIADPIGNDQDYQDIETGNIPWYLGYAEFCRNTPQAILDLIAQYKPLPESLDRISLYFTGAVSTSSSSGTETCPTCKNPHRCTCTPNPRPTPTCARCGQLKDGTCVCPPTGTRLPRKQRKSLPILLKECNIIWVEHNQPTKPRFGVDDSISINSTAKDDALVYEVNMTAFRNTYNFEEIYKRFSPYFLRTEEMEALSKTIEDELNTRIRFFVWNALTQYNQNQDLYDSDRDLINQAAIEARLCFDDNLLSSIYDSLKNNGATKEASKAYKTALDKKKRELSKAKKDI